MASLLPGNELPSPPLKKWPPSNSTPRPVGGASGPPGAPDDTWESVAKQYNLDVHQLIRFNFGTVNPPAVNWYLRTYVGCNTPSPSRWNWTFRSAKPGVIYLPISTIDFDAEDVRAGPGRRDGKPPKIPDFHFKDPKDVSDLADDIEHLPEVGKWFQAGKWYLYVVIGNAYDEAIAKNRESEYFTGVSLGIVLGADKRSQDFIVRRNLQNHFSYRDSSDRSIDASYQLTYLAGLKEGLSYSRDMNEKQRERLRKALRSQMNLSDYPSLDDTEAWSQGRWFTDYYIEAAAIFRRSLLPYWRSGNLQGVLESKYP